MLQNPDATKENTDKSDYFMGCIAKYITNKFKGRTTNWGVDICTTQKTDKDTISSVYRAPTKHEEKDQQLNLLKNNQRT